MADQPLNDPQRPDADPARSFAQQAEDAPPGLLAEFWDFLIHNKKWWLTPIVIMLLLFAIILLVGPNVPFIYTMF